MVLVLRLEKGAPTAIDPLLRERGKKKVQEPNTKTISLKPRLVVITYDKLQGVINTKYPKSQSLNPYSNRLCKASVYRMVS
jgi:hypothetical protein